MNDHQAVQDHLRKLVADNDVVLFMKGTMQFPQCGFSAQVAQIMQLVGVDARDVNVLEDMSIREGVKEFSNWPTIPQLYVKGEFIGGCDIIREMYEQGELQDLLDEKGVTRHKSALA
jgi:monothiol glutaredoxin